MHPKNVDDFGSLLHDWAERDPQFPIYSWIGDEGDVTESYTFAELDMRARAIAVELRRQSAPGDRALLLYPPGLEFISAFFACLLAGVIAVPAYPPLKPRDLRRVRGIARSARPTTVLGPLALRERLPELMEQVPELSRSRYLVADEVPSALAVEYRPPRISSSSVAFLQYTSGSTGDPKGVMVTHGNLLANEAMIANAFAHSRASVVVGWLPHFHDMGLIGNVLQPLYVGCRDYLMSPGSFLREPLRWLRAISKYRGTTSGGPNFAFELCALRAARSKTEQDFDLSSWDLAFVGAEPIRPATLDQFAKAFAGQGFRASSFYPCYGLAEATLLVSSVEFGAGARVISLEAARGAKPRQLVSCGRAAQEQMVVIVDPTTQRALPDGQEGEIWASGANIAAGYWERPEESAETFRALVQGDQARTYLRTGDLGVVHGEELLISGRLKDLIIVRGQNFYPQDIEAVVEAAHPAVRASTSAAFSFTEQGEERVVVVTEVARAKLKESAESACQVIRAAVIEECDLRIDIILLIAAQTIVKTSSGKIERRAARNMFLAGGFEVIGFSSLLPLPSCAWARGLEPRQSRAEGGDSAGSGLG